MISCMTLAATIALGVVGTVAHGGVRSYSIGGVIYNGFRAYNTPVGQRSIQREWDTFDPITDPTVAYMSCNTNGSSLGAGQMKAAVHAGSKVIAYWNSWPHSIGPVMVYMANCKGNCTKADTSKLEWFKIDEKGLISGDLSSGEWAQGQLIANNASWTVTIPSSLAPGEYMLRHELLSLHSPNQPQFYPECAQIVLKGSGKASPSKKYLVKFPGGYSLSDPGVTLDVYDMKGVTNYTIPGPAVWRG